MSKKEAEQAKKEFYRAAHSKLSYRQAVKAIKQFNAAIDSLVL